MFNFLRAIHLLLFFILLSSTNGKHFILRSEAGVIARVDLLNALKIALRLARPGPTREERRAALEFATFLNTSAADEYLEGFYAVHSFDTVNDFPTFLKGFVYNGDPYSPAWYAAEILLRMITRKDNIKAVEKIRENVKTFRNKRTGNINYDIGQNVDFVKLFKNPKLFYIKPYSPKVKTVPMTKYYKKYYRNKKRYPVRPRFLSQRGWRYVSSNKQSRGSPHFHTNNILITEKNKYKNHVRPALSKVDYGYVKEGNYTHSTLNNNPFLTASFGL